MTSQERLFPLYHTLRIKKTLKLQHGDFPDASEALKDKVIHLSLIASGIPIYLSDSYEPLNRGNGTDLSLITETEEEARTIFDKLAEGGIIKDPLQHQFWGALFGRMEDKFGVSWQVSNEVAPV